MRKYSFVFMILDEEGATVAKRDLTPEQAIDLLVQPEHIEISGTPVPIEMSENPPKKKMGRPKKHRIEEALKSTRVGRGKHPPQPCCGTTGSRHFKTCPKFVSINYGGQKPFGQPDSPPPSVAVRRQLTAEEYADLRSAMHDNEFQSARYALTNKLSPKEVNYAVVSKNYQDYLEAGVQ